MFQVKTKPLVSLLNYNFDFFFLRYDVAVDRVIALALVYDG